MSPVMILLDGDILSAALQRVRTCMLAETASKSGQKKAKKNSAATR